MATAIVHQLTNCSKTNQAPHVDTMPWVCAWSSSERQLIEACASRQCCSTNGDFKNWIWPIRRTSRVVRAGKMAEAAFPSLGYLCWWYHCYTGSMGMIGSLELLVSRKKPSLSPSWLKFLLGQLSTQGCLSQSLPLKPGEESIQATQKAQPGCEQ